MHERYQVINSGIFNEIVDISCTSCHDHSLHDSFEEKFDNVQVELQFEHPYWGKQMTEKIEERPRFYD